MTASVILELLIDKSGVIQEVTYKSINSSNLCKDELRKHLMSLKNFSPAFHDGQPVCCRYNIPIRCLLWQ